MENLPWFLKYPLKIYTYFIGFLAFILWIKPLKNFTIKQNLFFYNHFFKKLPFSNAYEKLVRTLGFIKIYDT